MNGQTNQELDRIAELFKGRNGGSSPQTANGAMLLEIAQQLIHIRVAIEAQQSEHELRYKIQNEIWTAHLHRRSCQSGEDCTCSQSASIAGGSR